MNKSIILVMCDILVLSAMSLSSGGFSDSDEEMVSQSIVIDTDVVPRSDYEALLSSLSEAKDAAESARASEKKLNTDVEVARANEARAKNEAALARANEAYAQSEAKEARANEAQAKAEVEVSHAKESQAKADAESARENEKKAKAAVEVARANEAQAKAEADAARASEAQAKSEAEAARIKESHAKADAEIARTQAALARNEAERAWKSATQAGAKTRELQAVLDEMIARQKALSGDIPQNVSWKMDIICEVKKGKRKQFTLHSPLLGINNDAFLFFETSRVGGTQDAILSVVATHGDSCITGRLCRVNNNSDLSFVKIDGASPLPHIGFGADSVGLDDNIVFYPEYGKCEGNPVPCEIDANGVFSCSSKTETRTLGQRVTGEGHSVYEGCFLLSKTQGAIVAIVRGSSPFAGSRKCDILHPLDTKEMSIVK